MVEDQTTRSDANGTPALRSATHAALRGAAPRRARFARVRTMGTAAAWAIYAKCIMTGALMSCFSGGGAYTLRMMRRGKQQEEVSSDQL